MATDTKYELDKIVDTALERSREELDDRHIDDTLIQSMVIAGAILAVGEDIVRAIDRMRSNGT